MLDEKSIEQSSKIVKELISEGKIVKPNPKTLEFFLKQSQKTLIVAQKLLELQVKEKIDANLWIINTSYYAMFFAATSLLAHYGKKLNISQGIHKATYHALVHYFVKEDNKLKMQLAEEYAKAVNDIEQTLQMGEDKIKELITNLDYELNKRKTFTYEIEEDANANKAITSLERAKNFVTEVRKMIQK